MVATTSKTEQLQNAFIAFNQQSGLLESSYRELQETVEALTRRLRLAQTERMVELVKKERLSQRLQHLMETLPGGIIVLDRKGIIQETNSQATTLLNRPLLGCSWAAIVKREFCGGGSEDGNLQLRGGRWLNLSRRPLQHEYGEILLLADVTNGRQMSELRQRQERLGAIGEMTAEFAHQVRTPLASAKLYAAQLDLSTPHNRRVASKISERLNDLGRLVNNMLGFAAGSEATEEPLAVAALLKDVSNSIRVQLRSETELNILGTDNDLLVIANKDALTGALHNLITNAEQACTDTAIISLSAYNEGGLTHLCVSDNGSGIPETVLPRLFEPFFTTRPQGTGLGLAVVQVVAQAHDGDVTVSSSENGTTFTIQLPACKRGDGENVDD